jgi:acetolactate synthase-1/2/3 large subunit
MAAKLARPKSKVIILYGDGSFGLHAMEFEAMARQKIPVVGIVGNDAAWTQIRRGQQQFYGPDRAPATALSATRYDRVVEALGGHGEFVEKPREIRPALERALSAGKPALVNIRIGGSDFRKDAISV